MTPPPPEESPDRPAPQRPELRAVQTTPAAPADPERGRGRAQRRAAQAAKEARQARSAEPAETAPEAPARKPARRPVARAVLAEPEPAPEPARPRARHWGALATFALLVLLPFLAATAYLYLRAADQYHSEVSFTIRSEEASAAAAGLLGALTQIGTGAASDADILFEFIQSQEIVSEIDAELDLRKIYTRTEGDPVFTLGDDPSIEALLDYWRRMVEVSYDSNAGIINVRANAFTPQDANAIATAILAKSSALVNRLSEQAREDAVRFAREELAEAEENLRGVRQRLATFRRENRIVDPEADVAGQMGLLSALQGELAQALVSRDVLLSFVGEEDQRVIQENRRITAITERIEDERASLGIAGATGTLPEVIGTYEELLVDLEFAATAYTSTLAGLAVARAEARRQSRYLAPHVAPTLAESALYPRRALLAGLTGLFLLLGWGILMLGYYNARDSR